VQNIDSNSDASVGNSFPREEFMMIRDFIREITSIITLLKLISHSKEDILRVSRGFDDTTKILLACSSFLPSVCKIVGRGLSRKEIGLLIEVKENNIGPILRSQMIRENYYIRRRKAGSKTWVKLRFREELYDIELGDSKETIGLKQRIILFRKKLIEE
jgi:hypothetical protein